jgi:hypothetical protein
MKVLLPDNNLNLDDPMINKDKTIGVQLTPRKETEGSKIENKLVIIDLSFNWLKIETH